MKVVGPIVTDITTGAFLMCYGRRNDLKSVIKQQKYKKKMILLNNIMTFRDVLLGNIMAIFFLFLLFSMCECDLVCRR